MVETREQPQQKDKVGMKTEGAREEQRKSLPKAMGPGHGATAWGGKRRALVPKLSDSSHHHCIFSFLQFRWTLFRLNSHREIISERGLFRDKYGAALLNSIDFSMKGCNISFMIWNRHLQICLGSETVGMRLYHPPANYTTLDKF